MKLSSLYYLLIMCLLSPAIALSQDNPSTNYPLLRGVRLKCRVARHPANGIYSYSYLLQNDSSSIGSIQSFLIDVGRFRGSVLLDTAGLKFAGSGLMEKWFREDYPAKVGEIVSFSFSALPPYWLAMVGNGLFVHVQTDTNELKPGNNLDGFVMTSRGLPSPRSFRAEPDFDVYKFFPDLEDTTRTMSTMQMDSIRNAVCFSGVTIGPLAPPSDFVAVTWCDTLTSYTLQSRTLGWITHQATAIKYLGYFSSARTELAQRDNDGARIILQQALKDLELDIPVYLSTEGFALLKFNTEFLVDSLPRQR